MASKSSSILTKLLNSMKKLSIEVNDHEICKKLELLISTTKEEINPSTIKDLFDDPLSFNPQNIPEPFSQYVRHFTYMIRRNERMGINQYEPISIQPKSKKAVKSKTAVKKVGAAKKKA